MNTNQFSSQSFSLQACSLDDQAGQRERKRINRKNEFLQNPLAINYPPLGIYLAFLDSIPNTYEQLFLSPTKIHFGQNDISVLLVGSFQSFFLSLNTLGSLQSIDFGFGATEIQAFTSFLTFYFIFMLIFSFFSPIVCWITNPVFFFFFFYFGVLSMNDLKVFTVHWSDNRKSWDEPFEAPNLNYGLPFGYFQAQTKFDARIYVSKLPPLITLFTPGYFPIDFHLGEFPIEIIQSSMRV